MDAGEKDIMLGIVIGDALGSAVEGFGKGHIHAHFKSIDNYIDPEPALKGNMAKWKKPGLYSSISQFAILLVLCPSRRSFIAPFLRSVAESPGVRNHESGIFRHADSVEKRFIASQKGSRSSVPPSSLPSSRIIPSSAPVSFRTGSLTERISDAIRYATLFTRDMQTVAAAISFACLVGDLSECRGGQVDFMRHTIDINARILGSINDNPGAVFELKLNPDILAEELSHLNTILDRISTADTLKGAEDIICRLINRRLKTPVTRATVNLPGALLPYALSLGTLYQNDPDALFHAVREGGSTAALAAMTGALLSGLHGTDRLPHLLVRNLVNRRRIMSMVDALGEGPIPQSCADDFLAGEASLTSKELDELAAKVKHVRKRPPGDSRFPGDREKELTGLVVESWTKMDRARWKKERRRTDKNDEF